MKHPLFSFSLYQYISVGDSSTRTTKALHLQREWRPFAATTARDAPAAYHPSPSSRSLEQQHIRTLFGDLAQRIAEAGDAEEDEILRAIGVAPFHATALLF